MKLCKHQNIVELYDCFELPKSIYRDKMGFFTEIVMEYCPLGTLSSYRENECQNVFSDSLFGHCLIGVIKGLIYLHLELNILHRDLKPENILLQIDPYDNHLPIVKLSDFGLSKFLDEEEMTSSMCGTPVYMAPEVYLKRPYNYKCDIWSLGATFFYLKTGDYPLGSTASVFNDKVNRRIPPTFSNAFWKLPQQKDFIQRLLVHDMYRRYEWKEVMKHPYIKAIWK